MHKQPVGLRVSAQLHAMLTADKTAVTQGPSATGFTVTPMQAGEYKVQVAFEGGTGPLYLNGTRYGRFAEPQLRFRATKLGTLN